MIDLHLKIINQKLDEILAQARITNGRVSVNEDNIIRLQERTGPWTAGGVSGGVALLLAAAYEFIKRH